MTSTTARTAYKKFSFNSTIAFNPISEISATTKDSIVTPFLPDCKGEEVYNSRVYKFTKKMPQFPGGNKALMNFIKNSLVYPEEALKNNLSGRVVLDLIIGIDGSIDHINISESSNHESLDRAAIAGVKNMPKWIPGELDGDPIRVKHALPIQFRLK